MPRPKRSKVAPSAPAPRVAKLIKPVAGHVPQPTIPKSGFHDMDDISDPAEGAVISTRRTKKKNGKDEATAAHGPSSAMRTNARDLAKKDRWSEPGEGREGVDHVFAEDRGGEVDIEDIDQESSSPAVEVGRRERSTPGVENSLLALGNFRRRPRQPSILGRAAARARSSIVESNLAQDNGLTSVGGNSNSVLGNPSSRQPSVSEKPTGHMRSSSTGLERGTPAHGGRIFNLGNFKKRPRQPSILGTAQKERQTRLDYDNDREDDFNPEDESTPLNSSKARDMTSSSVSNPRKRKLSAGQVPRSSPLPMDREIEQDAMSASSSPQVEAAEDECQSSEEAPLPSIEPEVNTEPMSETMAPPLSSSPTPESPPSYRAAQRLRAEREPARGRRRLRDRTPPPMTQDSPISSPPSLTHSPNLPTSKAAPKTQAKGGRQPPPPSTFSTAQLQALLPQRRRRGPRDQFDIASSEDEIDVSGLASDDDELTHSTVRAPPSRRSILPRILPSSKAARKSKATPTPKPGSKATYGKRAAPAISDKENEEVDPDDSLAPLPDEEGGEEGSQELKKRVGKELKRAARKFEEVDKWELEFEECTASSSSPKDAR